MAERETITDRRGRRWQAVKLTRAEAPAFHARPRATQDLDVYLAPTRQNARRVLEVLEDFFGSRLSDGVEDPIEAKRAPGRPQDKADRVVLDRVRSKGRKK